MLQNFFTKLISFVNVCWNACIILPIPKRISIRHLITAESRELFLWEINAMAKVNLTKFASANCTVMSLFQKQKEIHWSCRPVMKYFATRERMRPSLKHSTPILQTKAQIFTLVWWYVVMAWPYVVSLILYCEIFWLMFLEQWFLYSQLIVVLSYFPLL
jgi:hypothetical protein